MVKRVRVNASVGRQRITSLTPENSAAYVNSIRTAMNNIVANYQMIIDELGLQSVDVLYDALEPTFQLSQKYCPVDTGELKESGFLEKQPSRTSPRVVIGYAKGGKPGYAAFVHELTHLNHKAPTRSKFLLAALEEDAGAIQQRIIKGYKDLMGFVS